jgi:mannose-binding lectin 2
MRSISLISVVCCVFSLQIGLTFQYDQGANANEWFRREHSLSKPYGGTGTGIPYWDFVGSTIVTNKFIRLTSDSQSLQGGLWNTIVNS